MDGTVQYSHLANTLLMVHMKIFYWNRQTLVNEAVCKKVRFDNSDLIVELDYGCFTTKMLTTCQCLPKLVWMDLN